MRWDKLRANPAERADPPRPARAEMQAWTAAEARASSLPFQTIGSEPVGTLPWRPGCAEVSLPGCGGQTSRRPSDCAALPCRGRLRRCRTGTEVGPDPHRRARPRHRGRTSRPPEPATRGTARMGLSVGGHRIHVHPRERRSNSPTLVHPVLRGLVATLRSRGSRCTVPDTPTRPCLAAGISPGSCRNGSAIRAWRSHSTSTRTQPTTSTPKPPRRSPRCFVTIP